jgi:ABC-2 type transport system permease protein
MKHLLNIEWLKVKNYTAFKVVMAFFTAGIVLVNYLIYIFKKNVVDQADPTKILSSTSPWAFPKVWLTTSYYGGFVLMLPALLMLMLLTNEYTYRTSRQNIIDGLSRKQFIDVKLVMAALLALLSTIIVILTAVVFGLILGGNFSFDGFENVGYFFLKAFTYNLVAVLIGVLVKRTGFAIALFFIYSVFENGISLGLFALAFWLKAKHSIDLGNMGNYLPMNASDGLIYSPLADLQKMAAQGFPSDFTWLVFSLAIAYLVLFVFWSKRKVRNSDL